jgi:monoamine oxidase
VTVVCSDGSIYEADHVIVTVSLGVLKSSPKLFSPPLPQPKREAINNLGIGVVIKVSLEFSSPLVDDDYYKIGLIWSNGYDHILQVYPWLSKLYTFSRIGYSNCWITWFADEDAMIVQDLPTDIISDGLIKVLEIFLGKSIPTLVSMETVSWGKEKFFKGSYSYNAFGTGEKEREELAVPLDNLQVLFAGEATHNTLYSTTNGAYDTGMREGERLIKLYCNNN